MIGSARHGVPSSTSLKLYYVERKVMALDEVTVREIAKLARIKVPDQEICDLAEDLSKIFDWIEQLNEVDTDNVIPMTSVTTRVASKRGDQVTEGNYLDKVLANAPAPEGDFYAVPKVVE